MPLAKLLSAWAALASACPVCFGKSDGAAGLISGLYWGIAVLLGFTFLSVAGIAMAAWKIETRRAEAERLDAAANGRP